MSLLDLNDQVYRSKAKSIGRTLVVMGDSITDRAKIADASTYYWATAKAYLPYVFAEMGWPWRLVNIASATGEKVAQINARFKYGVIPYRPDDVIYAGGINDANAFSDVSNADALLNDVIEDFIKPAIDLNIRPIVCTILPSNDLNTTAKQRGWYRYNQLLREYSTRNPYMRLVDLQTGTYSDPANGYGGLAASMDDNVHPNSNGAARIGVAFRRSLSDLVMPVGGRGAVEGDIFNGSSNSGKAFLVANNGGTLTASPQPTPAGAAPTGWTLLGICTNNTGITITGSLEAATDGGMDWFKVVLAGSGMSGQTNCAWQFQGGAMTLAGSQFSPGDWVEMRADIEVAAGHTNLNVVSGAISFGGASRNLIYFPRSLNSAGFVAATDLSGFKRIGTPPFPIPADCTSIRALIEARHTTAVASAGSTIRIRNVEVRKVPTPNPLPQYLP